MRKALVCLLLTLACTAHADTFSGKVIHVADGDTITVLDNAHTQHKVRLAGIDAPESKQAFGHASKQSLVAKVTGQYVVIEWDKVDRFGRKVGKVLLGGQDVNLEQVRRGLAWHYKAYQLEQSIDDQKAYSEAESGAMTACIGLWRDATPVAPWDFRHLKK
jgi:endonuclease YncB( thermonuclease family)